jgi:hypothetical protein
LLIHFLNKTTMKKTLLKTMMILFGLSLIINISAQVQINGVSDSTAILNDAFSSQVDEDHLGGVPSYELLESPTGMTISASGEITWTPTNIASGGKVTVKAENPGGSDTFTFNVYVSDEVVCSPNLVAYYPLDETSGVIHNDFIDPLNNGTALTPLVDTAGKVGRAKMFKPTTTTTQFITVPDNDQMEYAVLDDFSVSMWVYAYGAYGFPSGDPNQVLWAREEISTIDRYILGGLAESGGSFFPRFRVRRTSSTMNEVTLSAPLPLNSWHLLTFVHESVGSFGESHSRIYVDGELPADGESITWFTSDQNFYMNSPLSIGWFPPSITEKNPFNGKMDEVLFFDKALTVGEIEAIYQDGLNGQAYCKAGNYAPLITNDFPTTVDEDTQYSVTVTTSDFDGDPVTVSDSVLPGWLSLNAGVLQGTPTNDDVGTHEVILKVNDGSLMISKTINIEVINTNDAPVITSSYTTAVDEDQPYTYDIEISDVDAGDVLDLSAEAPAWLFLNTSTNTLSGTPTNAVLGTEDFVDFDIKVKVTDAAGDSAVQNYVLRVTNVNDAPTVLGQNPLTTPGNTAIQLVIDTVFSAAHIVDVDDVFPDDFELTIQSGANYLLGADNTITPVDGFRGDLNVGSLLTDDGGAGVALSYTIIVSVANNTPVITSTPPTSIDLDGTPYVYNITAEDADQDDELVYSADLLPNWLFFDEATHILSGTPTEAGNYDVILSVTDGYSSVSQPFAIEVILVGIENQDASALRLYPVPASDKLFVQYSNSFNSGIIEIMDIKGNIIIQKEFDSFEEKLEIDLSEYRAGMYLYRVTFDTHVYTGKLVIE